MPAVVTRLEHGLGTYKARGVEQRICAVDPNSNPKKYFGGVWSPLYTHRTHHSHYALTILTIHTIHTTLIILTIHTTLYHTTYSPYSPYSLTTHSLPTHYSGVWTPWRGKKAPTCNAGGSNAYCIHPPTPPTPPTPPPPPSPHPSPSGNSGSIDGEYSIHSIHSIYTRGRSMVSIGS
jgi:hypothetical protein